MPQVPLCRARTCARQRHGGVRRKYGQPISAGNRRRQKKRYRRKLSGRCMCSSFQLCNRFLQAVFASAQPPAGRSGRPRKHRAICRRFAGTRRCAGAGRRTGAQQCRQWIGCEYRQTVLATVRVLAHQQGQQERRRRAQKVRRGCEVREPRERRLRLLRAWLAPQQSALGLG